MIFVQCRTVQLSLGPWKPQTLSIRGMRIKPYSAQPYLTPSYLKHFLHVLRTVNNVWPTFIALNIVKTYSKRYKKVCETSMADSEDNWITRVGSPCVNICVHALSCIAMRYFTCNIVIRTEIIFYWNSRNRTTHRLSAFCFDFCLTFHDFSCWQWHYDDCSWTNEQSHQQMAF